MAAFRYDLQEKNHVYVQQGGQLEAADLDTAVHDATKTLASMLKDSPSGPVELTMLIKDEGGKALARVLLTQEIEHLDNEHEHHA